MLLSMSRERALLKIKGQSYTKLKWNRSAPHPWLKIAVLPYAFPAQYDFNRCISRNCYREFFVKVLHLAYGYIVVLLNTLLHL